MSELTTSGPHSPDGFEDAFSLLGRPDIARAVRDVTLISDARADAHNAANLFRDLHVSPRENKRTHELRLELQQTRAVLGRWALMIAHQEFRTIDLARVQNEGNWDATLAAEREMAALGTVLEMDGEIDGFIPRGAEEAKRRIMLDPTLVAGDGLILVRRKRLMLQTQEERSVFADQRPKHGYGSRRWGRGRGASKTPMTATTHLEVDKVSEFILDTDLLGDINVQAAREVYAAMATEAPQKLSEHGPATEIVEAAIDARHPMLVPVTTTYYADRKYKQLRRVQDLDAA